MDATEHVNSLLAELGKAVGVPLKLEDGFCGLETKDGRRVVVAVRDGGLLCAYAVVAEANDANRSGLAEEAMRLNFFGDDMGGAWLAMDGGGSAVLLCAARDAAALDYRAFENLVSGLADLAGKLEEGLTLTKAEIDGEAKTPVKGFEMDMRFGGRA